MASQTKSSQTGVSHLDIVCLNLFLENALRQSVNWMWQHDLTKHLIPLSISRLRMFCHENIINKILIDKILIDFMKLTPAWAFADFFPGEGKFSMGGGQKHYLPKKHLKSFYFPQKDEKHNI